MPGEVVLDERVAPRGPWSGIVRAGDVLTIVDVGGNQSADFLVYAADDTDERYSAADTIAWQRNVYVRTGTVLRSNLGLPLMTVVGNEVDRQDTSAAPAPRSRTPSATATTRCTSTAAARTSSPRPPDTASAPATSCRTSTGS